MQVRGLPCAHNFHVECIDEWLRLNVKCPRCRCSVFPNLDLSALSNIRSEAERSSSNIITSTRYSRTQPTPSQSYRLRLHGLLRPIRTEDADLEMAEHGGPPPPVTPGGAANEQPVQQQLVIEQHHHPQQ